jgi:2-polyprenyl-3-methyl-5-hydroxy-6-metoxy-1,4-benzoquinol methylase
MTPLGRLVVRGIDVVNRRGKAVGVRLVKLTGKRGYAIHPKHLVDHPWHFWYVPHLRPTDCVLDVGCGNGTFVVRAARECRRIVGMEYDPRNLAVAARMARELASTTPRCSPRTSPRRSHSAIARSTPCCFWT